MLLSRQVQVPGRDGIGGNISKFGQTSEVSSIVYSQVMTQMFKKTGTYAKIAGMEIKEFSGLLHRDANEAFLRVMEGLRGNEGEIEKMIASMGDMGMEGKRAVGVLGVLANNTEVLRAQQRLANEAFDEGISLTNEFEVKNSNLAAQRAKAKKDLDERIKQLGEKLYPLMTHGMSLIKLTVSTLEVLVDLITKHGGKLLWLTGVLGTYWAVQKSVIAWRKIEEALITKAIALGMAEANGVKVMTAAKVVFVGAVKKATVAMKAFLLSLVTNPVGIITLSILSLGTAFYKAYQIIDETTGGIRRSLKRVQEAQREFARESTMEQMAIDRLFGKLDALTKGTSEYQKVKDEILSKYGQYLNGLSAEIQALDDVKGAYEAISTAAKQAARDRAIDTATTKATEAYVEVEVENLEKIREALQKTFDPREAARYFEQIKAAMQEGGTIPEDLQQLIDETFTTEHVLFMDKFTSHIYKTNPVQEAINAIRAGKTTLQREIDSVNELLANVGGRKNNVDPLGLESDMEVIDYVSPKGGNTSSIENQMIALKDRYAQRLITQEEYENKLDALELAHLEYRLKNEDMNEEKRVELRQKIADKKLEIAEKARRKEERVDTIIEAKSDPVLKEENAYRKRLEEAGLFGKKREDLTEKQLQALEILEREHESNKDKILKDARKKQTEEYMKGIDERIKNLQLGQSMEVMELQMVQSAELEGFSGSLFQRQELLKEHQRQELALSETHAGEMMALLGEIFGEIEGKEGDSGEMVLTEQQKNELKKRLAEVGLSLSKLKISREERDKKKQTDFDVLGMNASKWEEFFNNLRQGKAGIEEIEFAVGALGNAWSAY